LERRLLFLLKQPLIRNQTGRGGLMHPIMLWPILTFVAGVGASLAIVEDSANRSFFYWLLLPPLVIGALAVFSRLAF
jgi:hypothetical protein